jgi:hypothetical protein
VSWQLAVSVHVLIMARVGELPFSRVTPEGFEDLDCHGFAGDDTFIQVKEVGAGAGELTTARTRDAILHALDTGAKAIAIVTDGQLSGGLPFTGWAETLADHRDSCGALVEALVRHGLAPDDAVAALARVKLISLPWNLREQSEALLCKRLEVHPAVASFATSALYDMFGRAAADQRHLDLGQARTLHVGDIDSTLHDVQSAVDVKGLDAAVMAGVCRPADFSRFGVTSAEQFYLGLDGAPAHVAQGLDVIRASEMGQINEAAQSEGYAVIVGPSGSGKSVLLWRAARDVILGARVLRVARVASEADVHLLVRHVELLRPTLASPVVVAADNLGRPGMNAWTDAVEVLREVAHVFVLGAAREEDFSPYLLRGSARVVKPALDSATASLIAERVRSAGLTIKMAASEAHSRSRGLLMEFLSLLREGRHLEQVLASQAADLAGPERALQRAAARLVLAAHAAGLSLSSAMVASALASRTDDPSRVGDALAVLKDEHVLRDNGGTWTGLHELRSQTLTDLLHDSPPPTLADTMSSVARLLPPDEAGWLLRRAAERYPDTLLAVAEAVADQVTAASTSGPQVAELLEGAERADNAAYAAACLPVMRRLLPRDTSPALFAPMLYSIRNQGATLGQIGSDQWDRSFERLTAVAQQLPPRASTVLDAVARRLTTDDAVRLATEGTLVEGLRLLEALAGTIKFGPTDAATIFSAFAVPTTSEQAAAWARLIDALAGFVPPGDLVRVFGTLADRATVIARCEPSAVSLTFEGDGEPSLTVMRSPDEQGQRADMAWDSARATGGDRLNDFVVDLARQLLDGCPEAARAQVVTISPSGARYTLGDHEPGFKHMPRSAFPDRAGVRRNVGFQGALRLQLAAPSWTELLTEQARIGRELVELAADAPYRLRPNDQPSARVAWTSRLQRVAQRAGELAPRPAERSEVRPLSHAQEDAARREDDPVSRALSTAAQALNTFASNDNRAATSMALRDAASRIEEALSTSPRVFGLDQPLPESLGAALRRLARAALSANLSPDAWRGVRFGDGERVEQTIAAAAQECHEKERDLLSQVAASVPSGQLYLVPDPRPFPGNIDETGWLLTAEADDWDAAVLALAGLDSAIRDALACNVWLLAIDEGIAVSKGVSLTRHGPQPVLPLTRDSLESLATAAGLSVPSSSNPASEALQELADRLVRDSWATALHRRRPAEWPTIISPPNSEALAATRRDASALVDRLPAEVAPIVDRALGLLIQQVEKEVLDASSLTLAGEILDVLGRGPTDQAVDAGIWTALDLLSQVQVFSDGVSSSAASAPA